MQLKETIEKRLPLMVEHPVGGNRVIAELFEIPEGLVFFDVGWPQASLNPIHFLPGAFTGEGPWVQDDIKIRVIDPEEPIYGEYQHWMSHKGAEDTRERAKVLMEQELIDLL